MAGRTPEAAVDAFINRIRSSLECAVSGTAFGSGNAEGAEHSVTMYAVGQTEPNLARVATHGGRGMLLFRFALLYTVQTAPEADLAEPYEVLTSFYQHRILEHEEREIVVYDWAPAGISPVRTPHLHLPIAGSVRLKQRHGSQIEMMRTHLGNFHFPTSHIVIEDIVDLLIREFRVDSQRDDWESVISRNRRAGIQYR